MIEPNVWKTALELSFYTPDRHEAIEWVRSMLGQDGVLVGRVIRAFRRNMSGHRTPAWWVGQTYQRDDPTIVVSTRRRMIKLNADMIMRRRPIPPGWYTRLLNKWNVIMPVEVQNSNITPSVIP